VLGIWWRGLTRTGALAGLIAGGTTASAAVLLTVSGAVEGGLGATLLAQPAAWTVPLAFTVMVVVSLLTPGSQPRGVTQVMVRLHTPESLDLDRGEARPQVSTDQRPELSRGANT
jgi:cation/acetate symporter